MNIEKLDSRISKNNSLESRKTIGNKTYLNKPKPNIPEKNDNGRSLRHDSLTLFSKFNASDKCKWTINTYCYEYKVKTYKEHPYVKPKQLERVINVLDGFIGENDLHYTDMAEIITAHFERNLDTDWNINHFATEGILQNLFWEVIY